MTKDEIIRMAREAGFNASNGFSALIVRHSNGSWVDVSNELELFAHIVAAAKQERLSALEQQAEPVATVQCINGITIGYIEVMQPVGTKLYTHPPQRKPLTDEDIEQAQRTVWRSLPSDFDYTTSSWIEIGIRYAEAAHGIGESHDQR